MNVLATCGHSLEKERKIKTEKQRCIFLLTVFGSPQTGTRRKYTLYCCKENKKYNKYNKIWGA